MKTSDMVIIAALSIGGLFLYQSSKKTDQASGGGNTPLSLNLSGLGENAYNFGDLFSKLSETMLGGFTGLNANLTKGLAGTQSNLLGALGGLSLGDLSGFTGISDTFNKLVEKTSKEIQDNFDKLKEATTKTTTTTTKEPAPYYKTGFEEAGGAIGWINRKLGTSGLGDLYYDFGQSKLSWAVPGFGWLAKLNTYLVTPQQQTELTDYTEAILARMNEGDYVSATEWSSPAPLAPEKLIATQEATPSPSQESPYHYPGYEADIALLEKNLDENQKRILGL